MKRRRLITALLAGGLSLSAAGCLFDLSDDLGEGCDPGDEDYPGCLPVEADDPPQTSDGGAGGAPQGDGEPIVVRQDYRGALCESGVGVRIVVGNDNGGDGTLATEMDGDVCVDVGDVLSGGVGVAFCLDRATCLSWGIEFDLDSGVGVRICVDQAACVSLGVNWSEASHGDSRLCWDPTDDASVPSDEIFYEEIVCQPPAACGVGERCADGLTCEAGLCVLPDDGEAPDDGEPEAPQDPDAP